MGELSLLLLAVGKDGITRGSEIALFRLIECVQNV